jgi:DNA-binding Xre family transcriptional regulator
MENNLDTGKIIKDYLIKNKISRAALTRKLGKNANHIMYIQKQPSLKTESLWELCHALEHNFFQDIASMLPESYTTIDNHGDPKDTLIKELQQQITILKAEKEVLLQAFKK